MTDWPRDRESSGLLMANYLTLNVLLQKHLLCVSVARVDPHGPTPSANPHLPKVGCKSHGKQPSSEPITVDATSRPDHRAAAVGIKPGVWLPNVSEQCQRVATAFRHQCVDPVPSLPEPNQPVIEGDGRVPLPLPLPRRAAAARWELAQNRPS